MGTGYNTPASTRPPSPSASPVPFSRPNVPSASTPPVHPPGSAVPTFRQRPMTYFPKQQTQRPQSQELSSKAPSQQRLAPLSTPHLYNVSPGGTIAPTRPASLEPPSPSYSLSSAPDHEDANGLSSQSGGDAGRDSTDSNDSYSNQNTITENSDEALAWLNGELTSSQKADAGGDAGRKQQDNKALRHFVRDGWAKDLFGFFVGGVLFLVPAAVILAVYGVSYDEFRHLLLPNDAQHASDDAETLQKRKVAEASRWLLLSYFLFAGYFLARMFVRAIPAIVTRFAKKDGVLSSKVKARLDWYRSVVPRLPFVLVTSLSLAVFVFIFPHQGDLAAAPQPISAEDSALALIERATNKYAYGYQHFVFLILQAASLTTGVFMIQYFCVQLITVNFHRTAYADRIRALKYHLDLIDRLKETLQRLRSRKRGADAFAVFKLKRSRTPDLRTSSAPKSPTHFVADSPIVSPVPHDSSKKAKRRSAFAPPQPLGPTNAATRRHSIRGRKEEANDDAVVAGSQKLTRRLFTPLVNAVPTQTLPSCVTLGAFEKLYEQSAEVQGHLAHHDWRSEAKRAYALFDPEENGNFTREEMYDVIYSIYNERRDLSNSLRDLSSALRKLNTIFTVISLLVLVFLWTIVFNGSDDVMKNVMSFGSLLLAVSFVFGDAAKNLFEGVLFLFSQHPFDVGDRVYVEEENYIVREMGLITTTFERSDGQLTYASNSVLATKFIQNTRRSPPMNEVIELDVEMSTATEKLGLLEAKINEWITENHRDFTADSLVAVREILNAHQMRIGCLICYRWNWQDNFLRFKARGRILAALKDALAELEIDFTMPAGQALLTYGNTPNGLAKKQS